MASNRATAGIAVAAIAAGVGLGRITTAAPAAPTIVAHAVDLRADPLPDGGHGPVRRFAWGTALYADGGHRDIGPAARCNDSRPSLEAELELASKECEW